MPSLLPSSSGVVDVKGLGLDEGALAMTDNGGRILKILSSEGGGPYESNGSGTTWSMGSMTGSELESDASGPTWIRFPGVLTYALAVK